MSMKARKPQPSPARQATIEAIFAHLAKNQPSMKTNHNRQHNGESDADQQEDEMKLVGHGNLPAFKSSGQVV